MACISYRILSRIVCLMCGLFIAFYAEAHQAAETHYLVPNRGQWPTEVIARYQSGNSCVFITQFGMRIVINNGHALQAAHDYRADTIKSMAYAFDLIHSGKPAESLVWSDSAAFTLNFFGGKKQDAWQSDVRPVKKLRIKSIMPGVDLVYLVDQHGLKYQFELLADVDPSQLYWQTNGAVPKVGVDKRLIFETPLGKLIEDKPYTYNEHQGKKQSVKAAFKVKGNKISYKLGKYNRLLPLVIDPRLIFSTYSGSTADNWGFTATNDNVGNGYLGGIASNPGYPTSIGAFDLSFNGGGWDIAISKYNAQGDTLLYSTYLGGSNVEYPMSMVCDSTGQLVVLGKTRSADFPVTVNAYDTSYNGEYDLVVFRLSENGNMLVGSTFLGGSENDGHNRPLGASMYMADTSSLEYNYGDDSRGEVLLDANGFVYIASNTYSTNFPVVNPIRPVHQGGQDGILAKFNPTLSNLWYATFLGGSSDDAAYALAISHPSNTVFVAGGTRSVDFLASIASQGFDQSFNGQSDGWLIKVSPNGMTLQGKTFIGTPSNDQVYLLQLDAFERVYVAGQSRGSMPVLPHGNVYFNAGANHFVQRYSHDLNQLEFSTVLGPANSGPSMSPTAMLVDICSRIYLTGWGGSANRINPSLGSWPVTSNAYQSTTDGSDFYFIILDSSATGLFYASYFGGSGAEHVDGGTSRFNKQGVIYQAVCAGCGGMNSFPVTPGAYSTTNNSSNCNAALFKFDMEAVVPVAGFVTQYPDTPVCLAVPVLFRSTGSLAGNYFWDFGEPGATSNSPNPNYTYNQAGVYTVTLIVSNCFGADTLRRNVEVLPPPVIDFSANPILCQGDTVALQISGGTQYFWEPNPGLLDTLGPNPRFTAVVDTWLRVRVLNLAGCETYDSVLVKVVPRRILFADTLSVCLGGSINLQPQLTADIQQYYWEPHPWIADVNQANQTFTPSASSMLYFHTVDTNGCDQKDSVWIASIAQVQVNAGPDRFICVGNSFTLTANGAQRYLWNTGDTTASITLPASAVGYYWVKGFIDSCESLVDTVLVRLNLVEANFVFTPDTGYAPARISFSNRSTGDGLNYYFWDFGDGYFSELENPVHIYREPGQYAVRLIAGNQQTGCEDTIDYNYVFVDSIQLFVPNAFTPNGDGVNDVFKLAALNFEAFELLIFNRWGQLIFSTKQPGDEWDGSYQGEMMPAGAYPYLIKATGKNKKPYFYEGQISLIR